MPTVSFTTLNFWRICFGQSPLTRAEYRRQLSRLRSRRYRQRRRASKTKRETARRRRA